METPFVEHLLVRKCLWMCVWLICRHEEMRLNESFGVASINLPGIIISIGGRGVASIF